MTGKGKRKKLFLILCAQMSIEKMNIGDNEKVAVGLFYTE